MLLSISNAADGFGGPQPGQVGRLSEDLTPLGAERGANEALTIPAWKGGITEPPADYRPGDHHPDPFTDERPLFRIDASNSCCKEGETLDGLHVSDMTDLFNGALDRFTWELKGKREMYVPHNSCRLHSAEQDYDELALPGYIDPGYLDEDSYQISMADHYIMTTVNSGGTPSLIPSISMMP